MNALEFRHAKGWGRVTMPDGSEPTYACEMCRAAKKQHPRGGSRIIFCLGRPFMRVCKPCEKDVKQCWEGAL